jgi:membrane protease YdiL (CAAX protease family)
MTQVSLFLTGVFAVTWALCLLLRPAAEQGGLTVLLAWLLPTVWAPTIIASVVTLWSDGVAGVRKEFRRLRYVGGTGRWFAVGAAFPAVATAVAVCSARVADEAGPFTPASAILMVVTFQLMTGALGEELGWRGFLLPRLGKRFGVVAAAWLMAVLWSLWHIAGFFFPGTPHYQLIPMAPFLLFIVLFGFYLAFIFNRTGESILATILAHLTLNISLGAGGVQLSSPVFWWVLVGMYGMFALLISRIGMSPGDSLERAAVS